MEKKICVLSREESNASHIEMIRKLDKRNFLKLINAEKEFRNKIEEFKKYTETQEIRRKYMPEKECEVPSFYMVAGSAIEDAALEMAFNANRIAALTLALSHAKDEDIEYLKIQRECHLEKLIHNIEDFQEQKQ